MAQCPLVALLASQGADSRAKSRGFLSVAHLLAPFTTHEISVREPSAGQSFSASLQLDVRDISKDGHLLTLSVLPHVLTQALRNGESLDDARSKFEDVMNRWAEPTEQEGLVTYLACIFVVSVGDENPLGELSKLIQTQQTLHHPGSTNVIPPYCCLPKWASSHSKTLKHFVLLRDVLTDDESRCSQIFDQMCTTYGKEGCQILKLSSTPSEVDAKYHAKWNNLEEMQSYLTRGLEDARTHAAAYVAPAANITSPSPSSVSTISSAIPRVSPSPEFRGSPAINRNESTARFPFTNKVVSGSDIVDCTTLLRNFVLTNLVPHVEREMRQLLEQIGTRRGIIGKSITSGMKKWFTTGAAQSAAASPTNYLWESTEMHIRRLGDMAFMFGLYSFAHQQYRSVKKDFESDQAWIHHALASEMCAVALSLAQPNLNAKQFPVHYFESAIGYLLNSGGKYSSVMRCAFNASRILSQLDLKKEAANLLSRLSSLDSDQLVAVAQVEAAQRFEEYGMNRKAAFYRVLAGNRFSNAGIPSISFDCYRLAFPSFEERHWGIIDENLSAKLLTEGAKTSNKLTGPVALECIRRLVRVFPQLGAQQQKQRISLVTQVLNSFTSQNEYAHLELPTVNMNSISVICGERPLWNDATSDENEVDHDEWITIERAAHHCLYGISTPFRGMQLVSNSQTDNLKVRETPVNERFRVRFVLQNNLDIELLLKNVRFSISDIQTTDVSTNQCYEQSSIEELRIDPREEKSVELFVRPLHGCSKFKVDGLLFRLETDEKQGVDVKLPMEVRGRRLNKTLKQQKSKMYAVDERLHATVSERSWPLLDVRTIKGASKVAYCDQAIRIVLEVENIGAESVSAMSIATNGVDCVSAGWFGDDSSRTNVERVAATNTKSVVTFKFTLPESTPLLRVGEKRRVFLDVRAASTECSSTFSGLDAADLKSRRKPVAILIAYRGEFGSMREWRKVISVSRNRLIGVESTPLDAPNGIFSLSFRNYVAVNEAALSRVEIQRIRFVSTGSSSEKLSSLKVMCPRNVEVESEQSDTLCLSIDPGENGLNEVWLSKPTEFPVWPSPASQLPDSQYFPDEPIPSRMFGVLWKASVVDNAGHVTSLVGETFVVDPFEKENVRPVEIEKKKGMGVGLAISIEVSKTVSHDFKVHRMCEIPLRVHIKNIDPNGRTARVCVRFVSKIKEPMAGVHLLPPEIRQQTWVDRPAQRTCVGGNEEKVVDLKVRIAHASVYDVGAGQLQVEALFNGDLSGEAQILKIPSVLSVLRAFC